MDPVAQLERELIKDPSAQALLFSVRMIQLGRSGFEIFNKLYEVNALPRVYSYFNKHGYPSLIPASAPIPRRRFVREEWDIVDYLYGKTFHDPRRDFDTSFFRDFVTLHGDVDLDAVPDRLEDRLHYSDVENIIEFWRNELELPIF